MLTKTAVGNANTTSVIRCQRYGNPVYAIATPSAKKAISIRMPEHASAIFRGYATSAPLGSDDVTEKEKVRSSAEKLGIDTAGMNQDEIKTAILERLSSE